MFRKKLLRKMFAGAMLMVVCTVIFISQVPNLKIPNVKSAKFSIGKLSSKGPGGLTTENQSTPVNNTQEEEDDDEFKLELMPLKIHLQEFFIITHHIIQGEQLRDSHRKIFSPPPQR